MVCSELNADPNQLFLYEPAVSYSNVARTLAALARWAEIHDGHHHEKRRFERVDFTAAVIVAAQLNAIGLDLPPGAWVAFVGWSRNLSRTGLCLVSDDRLFPIEAIRDQMPILRVEQLTGVGGNCLLGMPRAGRCPLWTTGRVVRRRPVHSGMFELGFEFQQRPLLGLPNLCTLCKKLLHPEVCPPDGPEPPPWIDAPPFDRSVSANDAPVVTLERLEN